MKTNLEAEVMRDMIALSTRILWLPVLAAAFLFLPGSASAQSATVKGTRAKRKPWLMICARGFRRTRLYSSITCRHFARRLLNCVQTLGRH